MLGDYSTGTHQDLTVMKVSLDFDSQSDGVENIG